MHTRSGGTDPGRDGCRVPLPWATGGSSLGFSPAGSASSWLPQPDSWAGLTVAAQAADPSSMLAHYRAVLRLRRALPGLGDGPMTWLDAPDGVLAFARPGGVVCLVNLSADEVPLPAGYEVLLASDESGRLRPDSAIWLRADLSWAP